MGGLGIQNNANKCDCLKLIFIIDAQRPTILAILAFKFELNFIVMITHNLP
jgi:hypothetical protein